MELEIIYFSLNEIKRAAINARVREAKALCALGYLPKSEVEVLALALETKYFGKTALKIQGEIK